ncbi:exopolyphosphatase [Colletotrichum orchidophilum]|uniref:Exopolyphosphatase n=1 Tax=Colletotrichum orchidophilum TaxID=1209926 RepID=A0A1G4B154_9PEZI|nr:exopolyphosphatase [Colletotrichum orchidophilum]OHE95158.1 exopolyphosphatase [Colletotrichum orchidophilum]
MPPRVSLGAFLANARSALAAPQRASPLTLVIGNESADLDSLCSAVVYAYLRSYAPPHTLHIPISNLPRDDLKLRPEMTAALAHAQLKPSDLLTLDEIPQDLAAKDSRWVLVDHNALTGGLASKYSSSVVGCVDHHADDNQVPQDTGDEPRVVEKCGSCASLVVEYCRPAWEDLAKSEEGPRDVDEHLARLSLAAILIDTTNLKSKDKTTDKDISAVSFLEKFTDGRDAFFNEISAVKEDISSLGFRDVFRKDYKQWEDKGEGSAQSRRQVMGVSAIVQNLDYLLEKAGGDDKVLLGEFKKWAEEKKMDVGVIMTTSHPGGKFQRDLLLWAFNENAVDYCKKFYQDYKDELGLESWGEGRLDQVGGGEWRMAWHQKSLSSSRKQVAPMLRQTIKGGTRL